MAKRQARWLMRPTTIRNRIENTIYRLKLDSLAFLRFLKLTLSLSTLLMSISKFLRDISTTYFILSPFYFSNLA